jgi:pyruvate kinase
MLDMLSLKNTLAELIELKNEVLECSEIEDENKSLQNVRAYVKLRSLDVREMQSNLTKIGLSSLGRAQSCVIDSINQDIVILSKLLNEEYTQTSADKKALTFKEAQEVMIQKSKIFGRLSENFKTKVMVTLPSEAKESPELIHELIAHGTSVFRINTAHDDALTWNTMAQIIKDENKKQDRNVKIYVDLAGPKNRTASIVKVFIPFKIGSWREPKRVEILPMRVPHAITRKGNKDKLGSDTEPVLVVSDALFELCKSSVEIEIDDFERDRNQFYKLIQEDGKIFIHANKKITIFEDTTLQIAHDDTSTASALYSMELLPQEIRLFRGDKIIITKEDIQGCADFEYDGMNYEAVIGCTNKEIFPYVKVGDDIFIDDGKIGCKVFATDKIGVLCDVFLAKESGTALREEKGINFPNTDLQLSAITPTDEKNFEDIVDFADIIGISFAQSADDIEMLQSMLLSKNKSSTAIAPKIETKSALENLPQILEQLIKWENYALMIARGDLAIEIGFDNLPYIQEEIFGICEAAHVPVIYATQILEGKMKNNLPSRAEVTDAAFAQRADCVMLNKGPFVVDTVVSIKNILRKVHTQFQKNRQLLSVCETWKVK